jgi:SulP family sulfate permease
MVVTVVAVVTTHDLSKGVLAGVILSGLFFARKVRRLFRVTSILAAGGRSRTYLVSGEIFFASARRFADAFDYLERVETVHIDVSQAHFWDISAIGTLDDAVLKFRRHGIAVEIAGLNEASATLVEKFALHDKPGAEQTVVAH